MKKLPRTRSCFCCGVDNPLGFRFDLLRTQDAVETRFQFRPEYCGFPGVVHGGLVTAALDELMAWAVGVCAGQFAYAAELNVRFLRPIQPGVEMIGRGELAETRRGRLFLPKARILALDGALHARAEGKFLPLPPAEQEAMRAEFVDDAGELFGFRPPLG